MQTVFLDSRAKLILLASLLLLALVSMRFLRIQKPSETQTAAVPPPVADNAAGTGASTTTASPAVGDNAAPVKVAPGQYAVPVPGGGTTVYTVPKAGGRDPFAAPVNIGRTKTATGQVRRPYGGKTTVKSNIPALPDDDYVVVNTNPESPGYLPSPRPVVRYTPGIAPFFSRPALIPDPSEPAQPEARDASTPAPAPTRPPLPERRWRFQGYVGRDGNGLALLSDGETTQQVGAGDRLPDGSSVVSVSRTGVVLERDGKTRTISR